MIRVLDDSDRKLIGKVRTTPSLYDPRNPDFRLAYRKEQDWENVGTYVGLTAADARRRWTNLRDRYSRELRQLRLTPDKGGDLGKHEFFRLMDFLRMFVRIRKEKRRRKMYKYDRSWDGSVEDTIQASRDAQSIEAEGEEDEKNPLEVPSYEEEIPQNFVSKLEQGASEAEAYTEYVDDASDAFEEYVEQPPSATVTRNPDCGKTVIPIMLPPQTDANTYTLSTAQQMPSNMQHQQQQQPQLGLIPQQNLLSPPQQPYKSSTTPPELLAATEDYYFCKSIAAHLRQLSRRHKIKAQMEMYQILAKYIELEEEPQEQNS